MAWTGRAVTCLIRTNRSSSAAATTRPFSTRAAAESRMFATPSVSIGSLSVVHSSASQCGRIAEASEGRKTPGPLLHSVGHFGTVLVAIELGAARRTIGSPNIMTSARTRSRLLTRSLAGWAAVIMLLCTLAGCDKLSNPFRRAPLPDMGPRMPNSVKLTFDRSFTDLKMQYIDSCNSQHELPVGAEAESVLIDAASQNFQAVSVT